MSHPDEEASDTDLPDWQQRYEPGARPTVVVPGSGGTVSGTAFADLVSDDEHNDSDSSGDRSESD